MLHRDDLIVENAPGWKYILDMLYMSISTMDIMGEVMVAQCKEKFGTLRVYIDFYDIDADTGIHELANKYIEISELASSHVCQSCGAIGRQEKIDGWLYTLCYKCDSRIRAERKLDE